MDKTEILRVIKYVTKKDIKRYKDIIDPIHLAKKEVCLELAQQLYNRGVFSVKELEDKVEVELTILVSKRHKDNK